MVSSFLFSGGGFKMMRKEEAISILYNSAKVYKEYYVGYNYIVFYRLTDKNTLALQATYTSSNFRHLTGVTFASNKDIRANSFFDMCVKQRLSKDVFEFDRQGTTELKLRCIQSIFSDQPRLSMIGDYNNCRPKLRTDKLIGGTIACIGFVFNGDVGFYIPNTLLKEDIRKVTNNTKRVLAIFRKKIQSPIYDECVYCSKDLSSATELLENFNRSK